MKHLSVPVGIAVVAVSCHWAQADELKRSSLAGLSRVGAVIVTVANDTVSEAEVSAAVERRLVRAKIAVDGVPGPELLVSVTAERNRAEKGSCEYATFRVLMSLREAVVLDRAPEQGPVSAITWSTSGSLRRFLLTAPRLGIMDMIEDELSVLLRAVASDTQQADHEREK